MARRKKKSGLEKRKRSISYYSRFHGSQAPRESIAIVCEGEKTEPNYFKAIRREYRLTSVTVEIEGEECPNGPIQIVEHAISIMNEKKFDEVWCVMDTENPVYNPNFEIAISMADRSKGIMVAASNPAFEYWFLLHFVETSRPFTNCDELVRELQVQFPEYRKNTRDFSVFYDRTELAIERAKRVLANHPDSDVIPNPSTHVFRLMEKLKQLTPRY